MHERTAGPRWVRAGLAMARRPSLWPTTLRQARRLAGPGWWRHPPFLPVPDRGYLRFRLETQYGDPDATPDPQDLVTYLRWCRTQDRQHARRRRSLTGEGRRHR